MQGTIQFLFKEKQWIRVIKFAVLTFCGEMDCEDFSY